MKIEFLNWDTEFFQRKIGKIVLSDNSTKEDDLILLLQQGKDEGYAVIYCFGDRDFYINKAILMKFNGALVDRKIIFEGDCNNFYNDFEKVDEYIGLEPNTQLENLTYESGKYSRFQIAPYFSITDFRKLYKTWLINSLNTKISEKVFVINNNQNISGLATLSIKQRTGIIGLLAIDKNFQGKGFGTQLLNRIKYFLFGEGISTLEVATQLKNTQACSFYKRNGLIEKSINNIYHFDLKNV